MSIRDISRSSLRFFAPGWWLEGTSWQLLELHSQLLFGSLEEGGGKSVPSQDGCGMKPWQVQESSQYAP